MYTDTESREVYILIQIAQRPEGLSEPAPLKLTGRQKITAQHDFICSSFTQLHVFELQGNAQATLNTICLTGARCPTADASLCEVRRQR